MTSHVFPQHDEVFSHPNGGKTVVHNNHPIGGLTKRELFAAMAMQGLLANAGTEAFALSLGKFSADYADALIAELARGE